jgi:hypothetical protein
MRSQRAERVERALCRVHAHPPLLLLWGAIFTSVSASESKKERENEKSSDSCRGKAKCRQARWTKQGMGRKGKCGREVSMLAW